MAPETLEQCRAWSPKLRLGLGIANFLPEPMLVPPKIVRVVLPFSRRLVGLSRKISEVQAAWEGALKCLGWNIRLQVSYSKGSRPLAALVNNSNVVVVGRSGLEVATPFSS